MARYQYVGPGPIEIRDLGGNVELVRPGDVRELTDYPPWGPWECIDPAPESDPEPAAVAAPAPFLAPPAPAKEM